MKDQKCQLKIEFQHYWHPGTGSGRGSDVDAISRRDQHGLPMLPGKTLKGLLRDALIRWYDENLATTLLGTAPDATEQGAGLLRISNATLEDDIVYYLTQNPDLISGLYRNIYATAIKPEDGTALDKSLRGMEVIVPLTLYADIDEISQAKSPISDW